MGDEQSIYYKVYSQYNDTFDSKSTENKGLISTREKIRTKSVHSAENSLKNTDFWTKNLATLVSIQFSASSWS